MVILQNINKEEQINEFIIESYDLFKMVINGDIIVYKSNKFVSDIYKL